MLAMELSTLFDKKSIGEDKKRFFTLGAPN